jgi:Proteins of 100 residues with WXG
MSQQINGVPAPMDLSPIAVPADLETAQTTITGYANTIVGELDTLKQRLLMLPDTWIGQASADYQALQNEWNIGAQGLFGGNGAPGVLGDIAIAMGAVWGNYANCEWANTSTWAPGLGGK